MPENSSKNPDPIPSISFTALLNIFFKALSEAVKDFIGFFFRHKILISLFIIAGIIAGTLNYKTSRVYYKLSMIVRHNELTLKTYGQMLNNLNQLAETGSYETLSKSLGTDLETSRKIRTIGAVNLAGIDIRKDTSSSEDNIFLIQMTILDNAIADNTEKLIVNYFNNNAYLNKLKQDEVRVYMERMAYINSELARMDSLKDAYNKFLAAPKSALTYYNNALNPADIYRESNTYSEMKTTLGEWLLQKKQPLVTVDGFKPSIVPSSINLIQSVITYAAIFFFIGCLLSGILEIAGQGKK